MDVSTFLLEVYEDRRDRNISYSKRAFSRDLGVSQSFTVNLLNGKAKLSEEKAYQIALNLQLNQLNTKLLLQLVRLENAKNLEYRAVIKNELEELKKEYFKKKKISEYQFRAISNWYTGPIFNLIFMKKGKISNEYISEKLKIPMKQVKEAISTMLFLGMLKIEKGKYAISNPFYEVESVPSLYIRKYHHAILGKADAAIDKQTVKERDISGLSIPFCLDDMDSVKQDIKEFVFEMSKYSKNKKSQHIYYLSVQFFKLNDGEIEL